MPGHSKSDKRGAYLCEYPVVAPVFTEDLAHEGEDNAGILQINPRELARAGRHRNLELHEFFGEVLGPHHDGVAQNAQREDVNEHPARVRDKSLDGACNDKDHHPDCHGTRGPAMPRAR